MAQSRKPKLRKIKSLKKPKITQASETAEPGTTPSIQEINVEKPDSTLVVNNSGPLDSGTKQALQTEEAVLFRTKSIFPLDIIPNELIIKEKSVSVIWNHIINSSTQTMLLDDIGYVTINDNLLLAALIISYKSPLENIEIRNLKPQDAYQAKSIIEKLMIQLREGGLDKRSDEAAVILQ